MPFQPDRMIPALLIIAISGALSGVVPPRAIVAQPAPAGAQAPLQPGDAILVRLPGDSVFRDTLFVDAGGRIALPRIGPVAVDTTAATDVPALIRQSLSSVARAQDASVRPLRRVTVVGDVLKPGVLYLDVAASLRDAVASAGALGEMANTRRVALVRQGVTSTIRDWQVAIEASAPVASGDVIAVPREGWLRRNLVNVSSTILLVITSVMAATRP